MNEEGWYVDPYRDHQHRWYSAGEPTDLVRDGGVTSRDDPPPIEPRLPFVMVLPDEPPTAPAHEEPTDPERTGEGHYVRQAIDAIYNPFGRPRPRA